MKNKVIDTATNGYATIVLSLKIKGGDLEEYIKFLIEQTKNNVNIIDIRPVDNDPDTKNVTVRYEFQWRHAEGKAPHWTKACTVLNLDGLRRVAVEGFKIDDRKVSDDALVVWWVLMVVREARKELEK